MAIDLTEIVTGIVSQAVVGVNALQATVAELDDLNDYATDAGVASFVTYEAAIQAAYPHLDGAKLNQMMGVIAPALVSWLNTQTIAGGTYDGKTYAEMLNMIRTQ